MARKGWASQTVRPDVAAWRASHQASTRSSHEHRGIDRGFGRPPDRDGSHSRGEADGRVSIAGAATNGQSCWVRQEDAPAASGATRVPVDRTIRLTPRCARLARLRVTARRSGMCSGPAICGCRRSGGSVGRRATVRWVFPGLDPVVVLFTMRVRRHDLFGTDPMPAGKASSPNPPARPAFPAVSQDAPGRGAGRVLAGRDHGRGPPPLRAGARRAWRTGCACGS